MAEQEQPRPDGGAGGPDDPDGHAADAAPDAAAAPGAADSTAAPDAPGAAPAGGTSADEHPPTTAASTAEAASTPGRRGLLRRSRTTPRRKAPWWELPALIVVAVGVAILVKSFVIQPFYIPSDSMEKTLHGCPGCSGDRILVFKPVYDVRDPHPGDIVVFHDPTDWGSSEPVSQPPSNPVVRALRGFGQLVGFVPPDGQVLVKRVIAVGGETVKGTSAGAVMVSDHGAAGPYRTLNEPFVYAPASESGNQPAFGPVTVPKGRLWVMGDHRTDSADSRYHCQPGGESTADDKDCNPVSSTVPVSDVIGKAVVIAWPPSRWRTLGTPSTFTSAAGAFGPALPGVASAAAVLPVAVVRRRRRRR